MRTAARLGAFGAGLLVVLGGSYAVGAAVVPASVVEAWGDRASAGHEGEPGEHGDHGAVADAGITGLAAAANGYALADVTAPGTPGAPGTLSFRVVDLDGAALTTYTPNHERDLHLVVVRSDGQDFRHVHPTLAADGTWSLPWTWGSAGSYRVIADFVPADGAATTLATTVEVGGEVVPSRPLGESRTARVGDLVVHLAGDLTVGGPGGELVAHVERDGEPVTALEPYLGAFGHLVALRQSDLGYLHVHPEGAAPSPDDRAGPEIAFHASAPTAGRYLLYLDLVVDGQVHTAPFVLDAGGTGGPGDGGGHEGHEGEEHGHDHTH
ncbi:MAG TPA: heavy-metal-associated domain-containing protein [Nocardioides sp.]